MFNGMEGDQCYTRMISDSLSEVNSHLAALTDKPGNGTKALRL